MNPSVSSGNLLTGIPVTTAAASPASLSTDSSFQASGRGKEFPMFNMSTREIKERRKRHKKR